MDEEKIRKVVRDGYAKVAKGQSSCCGSSSASSCCGGTSSAKTISKSIGYSENEMAEVPAESNLGLGCGNPIAFASLKEGEIVLDLGSGAGFDCFLAAGKVGNTGKVIGVDMTPEMIEKARRNANDGKFNNVEFRLGEIESLPVADGIANIIISNCVINLVPNKDRAFSEAFRALKPGGRLMVSDIVLNGELPEYIRKSASAYVGCISGAIQKNHYLTAIRKAGFGDIRIVDETSFPISDMLNDPSAQGILKEANLSLEEIDRDMHGSVLSIKVSAIKPGV
jgi:SAM-dependent methyltransferase